MSTDLAKPHPTAVEPGPFTRAVAPRTYDQAMGFCQLIARTDMVPKAFRNNPVSILVCVMMGERLGYDPFQSLQNIAVVNGKPMIYGDEPLARVQRSADYEWHEEDDLNAIAAKQQATCTVKRRGSKPHTVTFTVAQADNAGLWGKQGPWSQYPERMLQLRARSFALRNQFASALGGIFIREEYEADIKDAVTGETSVRPDKEGVVSADESHHADLAPILSRIAKARDSAELEAVAQDAKSLSASDAKEARRKFVERRREFAKSAKPAASRKEALMMSKNDADNDWQALMGDAQKQEPISPEIAEMLK